MAEEADQEVAGLKEVEDQEVAGLKEVDDQEVAGFEGGGGPGSGGFEGGGGPGGGGFEGGGGPGSGGFGGGGGPGSGGFEGGGGPGGGGFEGGGGPGSGGFGGGGGPGSGGFGGGGGPGGGGFEGGGGPGSGGFEGGGGPGEGGQRGSSVGGGGQGESTLREYMYEDEVENGEEDIVRVKRGTIQERAESSSTATNEIPIRGILNQLRDNHDDVQYGKLIATGESVIVIYTSDDLLDGERSKSAGIKTMYKNTNGFDQDNERAIDFELGMKGGGLTREENVLMQNVVKANSDTLWNNHENLNGIHISAVRTKGGKAFRDECIVLRCKFKGFLLVNEEEFPRMLSSNGVSFPVDVREGHTVCLANHPTDKLEPLACGGRIIGCCIDNKVHGTIGPFVHLPNDETGFLTCAHVLDNNPAFGVQHGRNDLVYQPSKGPNADCLCGEVVNMCFRPSADPSIDAAIVRITSESRVPLSTNFVTFELVAFHAAGIAEGVTFNSGTIGNHLPNSPLLKFGAFTPVLKCVCSGIGHEETIKYPQGMVLMKGFSKMLCDAQHKHGDSGAGVFVKNDEGELECVGLFFAGRGREGYFTPINDVLKQFQDCQLKSFN